MEILKEVKANLAPFSPITEKVKLYITIPQEHLKKLIFFITYIN